MFSPRVAFCFVVTMGLGTSSAQNLYLSPAAIYQPVIQSSSGKGSLLSAVADINNDGYPDVVTATQGSTVVSVFLGDGTGALGPRRDFDFQRNPVSIAVGDVNGDGNPDVVVIGVASNAWFLSVLLGDGKGNFISRETPLYGSGASAPGVYCPASLALADVNGDGRLDVVMADGCGGSSVFVMLGRGDGQFGTPARYARGGSSCCNDIQFLRIADLNGDGYPDIVTANWGSLLGSGSISVLLGKGDGTFSPPIVTSPPDGVPGALAVADVNKDGKLDVVALDTPATPATGDVPQNLWVFLGDGTGGFYSPYSVPYPLDPIAASPSSVVVADLNHDGNPDIVLCDGQLVVMLGDGKGGFTPGFVSNVGLNAVTALAADFRRNGFPDLIVGNDAQGFALMRNSTAPFSIAATPVLAPAQKGTFYSQTLYASGGAPPYHWSVVSGTLPAGLGLYGGATISGIPLSIEKSTFTVQATDSGTSSATQNFTITVTQGVMRITSVVNEASQLPGPVAPGELVVINGTGLGYGPAIYASLGADGLFDTEPAPARFTTGISVSTVSFNGIPAPITCYGALQVCAIVPYATAVGTAQVTVTYEGQSVSFPVAVAASAPGLFTADGSGKGRAAGANDGGVVAKIGGLVSLYATGEGQTTPAGIDGKPANTEPYPKPILPVIVTIGGQPARLQYAGTAPREVAGIMQIVAEIPAGIRPGPAVPVSLQVGDATSQPGITISVQ